jgi:hypothetical protein
MIRVLTDIEFDGDEQINLNSLKVGPDATNYLEINSQGELRLEGTASVWDDLLQPATSGKKGANDKPDFNYTEMTVDFPQNDTTEILYFNIQLPHTWKEGSFVFPHVHFLQNQTNVPTFKIDHRWAGLGESFSNWETYTMSTLVFPYTSGTVHQIVYGNPGISGAGKGLSSMLQIKLYRDDNVFTGDCSVLSFDIHIEISSLGSFTEFTKY